MKRTKLTALICLFALALAGCRREPSLGRYQASFLDLFDTATVITGYAASESDFRATVQLIYDELKAYHQLYDIYNEYEGVNNIRTINDRAGKAPVKVDERIIGLLRLAAELCRRSGGRVNAAMGSVLSLWHEAREFGISQPEEAYLPDDAALKEASRHADMDGLIIDDEKSTVYLSDPDMSLDVGAIAKGYAVEAVCSSLEERGIGGYIISVGGNIKTVGPKPGGEDWSVGVENPLAGENESPYIYTLKITGLAVVTSGAYQRYYTVGGVRYHHIINPETLYPDDTYELVTVVSEDSGLADALSTALFNMDQETGLDFIKNWPGTEALWLYPDGEVRLSEGFEKYIAK